MDDVGTLHRVPLLKAEDSIKLGDRTVPLRGISAITQQGAVQDGTIIEFNLVV